MEHALIAAYHKFADQLTIATYAKIKKIADNPVAPDGVRIEHIADTANKEIHQVLHNTETYLNDPYITSMLKKLVS